MGEIRAGNIDIEAEESLTNDGSIISANSTRIKTKKYSGKGNIISGKVEEVREMWFSKPRGILILGIIASLIAGIILYFIFN